MIVCYFGKLGQGKTYAMTEAVLWFLDQGRTVYVNYWINWKPKPLNKLQRFLNYCGITKYTVHDADNLKYIRITNPDDFLNVIEDLEDAVIALDEGWLYLDSYVTNKLPLSTRMKLLQSRKDGLDFLFTTQRPMQIHKSLRTMVNIFYQCYAQTLPLLNKPIFYRVNREISATGELIEESDPKFIRIFPKKRVFESFDTLEKIVFDDVGELAHQSRLLDNENNIATDEKNQPERHKDHLLSTKMPLEHFKGKYRVILPNLFPQVKEAITVSPHVLKLESKHFRYSLPD